MGCSVVKELEEAAGARRRPRTSVIVKASPGATSKRANAKSTVPGDATVTVNTQSEFIAYSEFPGFVSKMRYGWSRVSVAYAHAEHDCANAVADDDGDIVETVLRSTDTVRDAPPIDEDGRADGRAVIDAATETSAVLLPSAIDTKGETVVVIVLTDADAVAEDVTAREAIDVELEGVLVGGGD